MKTLNSKVWTWKLRMCTWGDVVHDLANARGSHPTVKGWWWKQQRAATTRRRHVPSHLAVGGATSARVQSGLPYGNAHPFQVPPVQQRQLLSFQRLVLVISSLRAAVTAVAAQLQLPWLQADALRFCRASSNSVTSRGDLSLNTRVLLNYKQ